MYGLSVASSLIFDIELICVIHSKCVLFLLKNRSGCMWCLRMCVLHYDVVCVVKQMRYCSNEWCWLMCVYGFYVWWQYMLVKVQENLSSISCKMMSCFNIIFILPWLLSFAMCCFGIGWLKKFEIGFRKDYEGNGRPKFCFHVLFFLLFIFFFIFIFYSNLYSIII